MDTRNGDAAKGQVNAEAARVYDAFFVPALFGAWAGPACDAASIRQGDRVLDVACGTGAAAREAVARVGGSGAVIGIDCNPGMLAVAREAAPQVDWQLGQAEALPFDDGTFDAVLCQFGLMFFEDRVKALREMRRVLRPGGRTAILVWDRAGNSPGYARMIGLIERLLGRTAANALRAPFALGDRAGLERLLSEGGWGEAHVTTRQGTARFESIHEWVRMDVRGWTLADMIDDTEFEMLAAAAEAELADFRSGDGTVSFAAPAHVVAL